ncbi:Peptide methionine sulfoxide reductase MsrB [Candidatus Bilamarchaeum dharawalense]|uniref:Peptide methionine sulfoxide reductase MsrA n=1 Tax=Candidatus Bilamarchaeum dharawalense TaxID=2885759 RepID=A0A5E4LPN5_9ARCH|nr:Peptide methionine sulfoxide reductase MsrB [Candidatus Bilamarchaeum dharawalense]
MRMKRLTREEEDVIVRKGTEHPFTGEYDKFFKDGMFVCRRCNAPLYLSRDKFDAHCGWPSFDQEIHGRVKRLPDGMRTEIQCAKCGAHLGHVFEGENWTRKNTRHCINSISMRFIPKEKLKLETVVLGAGCFWCSEAVFLMVPGIFSVIPGYAGGTVENPNYKQVSEGTTGHSEVVKLEYDSKEIAFRGILELFFAMHDPTTPNKQGHDEGSQYRSIILYSSMKQKKEAEKFLEKIQDEFAAPIVTEIKKLEKFYPAEKYHQHYYENNQNQPYCRMIISPKLDKIKKLFKFF